jgi:hypothetical protein
MRGWQADLGSLLGDRGMPEILHRKLHHLAGEQFYGLLHLLIVATNRGHLTLGEVVAKPGRHLEQIKNVAQELQITGPRAAEQNEVVGV